MLALARDQTKGGTASADCVPFCLAGGNCLVWLIIQNPVLSWNGRLRPQGPPPTPLDQDYAATGSVPPATAEFGLASIALRVSNRAAWRSAVDARWLVADNVPSHRVSVGDVVAEGARAVAYFHVEDIDAVV